MRTALTISNKHFRTTLGKFTTGECVVTAGSGTVSPLGTTINAFCSVSLEPPQILFCLRRLAGSYASVMASPYFVVNILTKDQQEIAERCTVHGGGGLREGEYTISKYGPPILKGCLATIECKVYKNYPGGDHTIIVAQVLDLNCDPSSVTQNPLLFFNSQYCSFGDKKPEALGIEVAA